MNNALEKFRNKRILIWGYGREGKSTETFFKDNVETACLDIYEGDRAGIDEDKYDFIFKSPGIAAWDLSDKFTSQTELFLEAHKNQVIGITGTKGKSTTSAMLYTVLKACSGRETFFMGNIGEPCLNHFNEVKEDSIVVFEMSCHQLAHLKVSPHVGVMLNLFEEHLDYYGTMEKYFNAKKNVTLNQNGEDVFYVGAQVPQFATDARVEVIGEPDKLTMKLFGEHNQYNGTFVKRIAVNEFGCDEKAVEAAIADFGGLPHRLEYVGEFGGVRYYDDSISTIPEASIRAIESIDNVKSILIGGMDRNIDYSILVDYIQKRNDVTFICMYASGKRIYDEVANCDNVVYVSELFEAVQAAASVTPSGSACELSPAAASYGYFKDFEDRGNRFKEMVKANR